MQVAELNSKISEIETGINRHQYEASEVKVLNTTKNIQHVPLVFQTTHIHCTSNQMRYTFTTMCVTVAGTRVGAEAGS